MDCVFIGTTRSTTDGRLDLLLMFIGMTRSTTDGLPVQKFIGTTRSTTDGRLDPGVCIGTTIDLSLMDCLECL